MFDAVVLVPGILGSELLGPDDSPVWGLRPKPLAKALVTGSIFGELRRDVLKVGGLLRSPGYLPGFDRFDPYTDLYHLLCRLARHDDAVLAYPYDWRRHVGHVAAELAVDAAAHLERWRRHPNGSRDARLVLIGHSMGGLIAHLAAALHTHNLRPDDVRMLLTLGTPFGGSVKAVRALAEGGVTRRAWQMAPWVKRRLQTLACETQSVHDLLPTYPCVGPPGTSARRASTADLLAAGASPAHLTLTESTRRALTAAAPLQVPVHALVGESQPTLQGFVVRDGEADFFAEVDGTNWGGDGTVYFGSAYPVAGQPATGLPQKHGALAKSSEALSFIRTKLLGGEQGPRQGDAIGLQVDDAQIAGTPVAVEVIAPRGSWPTCTWREPATGLSGSIALHPGEPERIGGLDVELRVAHHLFTQLGHYTIELSGGGVSPVRADVVVVEP